MHYKDGTKAEIGDLVFGPTAGGSKPVAGYVIEQCSTSDSCNVYLAALRRVNPDNHYGTCLSIGSGHVREGERPARFYGATVTEIASCKDLTLLHRPDLPQTENTA